MTSVPTNDTSIPLVPQKKAGLRSPENSLREISSFRAEEGADDNAIRLRDRSTDQRAGKAAANCEPQQTMTFETVVEEVDDFKAPAETPSAIMEFSTATALSPELAALLRGSATPETLGEFNLAAVKIEEKDVAVEGALVSPDLIGDEMSRLAEQLSARATSFGRVTSAVEPTARPARDIPEVAEGKAAVAVSELRANTGFDAQVKVTTNQQRWFQSIAPALTGLPTALRAESTTLAAISGDDAQSTDAAVSVSDQIPEGADAKLQPLGNQDSGSKGSGDAASKENAKRDVSFNAAVGAPIASRGVDDSVSEAANMQVAPPYQQVRSAVAEAIVNATTTQRTDYVSLYADRPTSLTPTLKTLELSLEPADLGRVNVKMNLASRDLKLEIEASKASTAQLLANDQAALKRELLSDNFDLSSVLVSVTNAVTDASATGGATGGDQQFSGHSRTTGENAFASSPGSERDNRKNSQQSGRQDDVARPQGDVQEDSGVRTASKALYI